MSTQGTLWVYDIHYIFSDILEWKWAQFDFFQHKS